MVPQIETVLQNLQSHEANPGNYEGGHGYWDDFCLASFLLGVSLRYVAYPVRSLASARLR